MTASTAVRAEVATVAEESTPAAEGRRSVAILGPLRGLAALAVAWFHFTQGSGLLAPGALTASGTYGWAGVELFFVISGYVIPLSLARSRYRVEDFARFMAKRFVRLEPAFAAAIAIAVALNWLSAHAPGFRGTVVAPSLAQIASHLVYVTPYVGQAWLVPVFWTLAIEMQYYIILGLAFGLLVADRVSPVRLAIGLGLAVLAATVGATPPTFLHYAPLFAMGFAVFLYHAKLIGGFAAFVAVAACAGALATFDVAVAAFVGIGGALSIAIGDTELARRLLATPVLRALAWVGEVRYSLYLLHVPIGGRIVNLGARYAHSTPSRVGVLALAVGASLLAAYVLYLLVERPSHRWSSAIRSKRPPRGLLAGARPE